MRQLIAKIARKLGPPLETLDGYEQSELIEVIFQKTKAYEPDGSWPEMAGVSSVLDFGGGCGLHYKLAKLQSPKIRWAVVETPAMVARASELSTDHLRFFASMADAANWLGPIDVMHSNGALQYTSAPKQTLRQLCDLGAKRMLWQRMNLSQTKSERTVQASNLIDNGPGKAPAGVKNKTVKYPLTKIPESLFLDAHKGYQLEERGKDWFRFTQI